MIGKIIAPRDPDAGGRGDLKPLLSYLLAEKDSNGEPRQRAELIGGTMSGVTVAELAAEFQAVIDGKSGGQKLKRSFKHATLRLAPDEGPLTDDQWNLVASKWAREMGFDAFAVFAHDRDHIHIVASRIRVGDGELKLAGKTKKLRAGERVPDGNERSRSLAVVNEINRMFGWPERTQSDPEDGGGRKPPTQGQMAMMERGDLSPALYVRSIIDQQLDSGPSSVSELIDRLDFLGVEVAANIAGTGKVNGLSYRFGDHVVTAKAMGRAYTWQNLQKRGLIYDADADLPRLRSSGRPGTDGGGDPLRAAASKSGGADADAAGQDRGRSGVRGAGDFGAGTLDPDASRRPEPGAPGGNRAARRNLGSAAGSAGGAPNAGGAERLPGGERDADRIADIAAGDGQFGPARADRNRRKTVEQLRPWTAALPASSYVVRVARKDGTVVTHRVTAEGLLFRAGFLRRESALGAAITAAPADDRYIVARGMPRPMVMRAAAAGMNPAVVIREGPLSNTVVYRLDRRLSDREKATIETDLSWRFRAEPTRRQHGLAFMTLPGFTIDRNVPTYAGRHERGYARLVEAEGGQCRSSASILKDARDRIAELKAEALGGGTTFVSDESDEIVPLRERDKQLNDAFGEVGRPTSRKVFATRAYRVRGVLLRSMRDQGSFTRDSLANSLIRLTYTRAGAYDEGCAVLDRLNRSLIKASSILGRAAGEELGKALVTVSWALRGELPPVAVDPAGPVPTGPALEQIYEAARLGLTDHLKSTSTNLDGREVDRLAAQMIAAEYAPDLPALRRVVSGFAVRDGRADPDGYADDIMSSVGTETGLTDRPSGQRAGHRAPADIAAEEVTRRAYDAARVLGYPAGQDRGDTIEERVGSILANVPAELTADQAFVAVHEAGRDAVEVVTMMSMLVGRSPAGLATEDLAAAMVDPALKQAFARLAGGSAGSEEIDEVPLAVTESAELSLHEDLALSLEEAIAEAKAEHSAASDPLEFDSDLFGGAPGDDQRTGEIERQIDFVALDRRVLVDVLARHQVSPREAFEALFEVTGASPVAGRSDQRGAYAAEVVLTLVEARPDLFSVSPIPDPGRAEARLQLARRGAEAAGLADPVAMDATAVVVAAAALSVEIDQLARTLRQVLERSHDATAEVALDTHVAEVINRARRRQMEGLAGAVRLERTCGAAPRLPSAGR